MRLAAGRVILFVDELHLIMDAGRVEGGMNAGARAGGGVCCGVGPERRRAGTRGERVGVAARNAPRMLGEPSCRQLAVLARPSTAHAHATPTLHNPPGGAANLLKPALARGELHCIGATTVEEYRKHVEADGAFARRFQVGRFGGACRRDRRARQCVLGLSGCVRTHGLLPHRLHARRSPAPALNPPQPVMVEEPTPEEALTWLQGLRARYERHHGVRFTDAALGAGRFDDHSWAAGAAA